MCVGGGGQNLALMIRDRIIFLSRYNSYMVRVRHVVTNRKSYMGSPMAPLDLTLSALERSNSRSLSFQSLISRKRAELGPILVLTINMKPYMGSPVTS